MSVQAKMFIKNLRVTLVVIALLLSSLTGLFSLYTEPAQAGTYPGINGKILFTSGRNGNYGIFTMGTDGGNIVSLTSSASFNLLPSWTADGSEIVFVSLRDGNFEVYTMNADGSEQTNVSNNASNDTAPSWSPDGSKIVFSSLRSGNNEIYVMNADGTNQTNLSNNAGNDNAPAWSADGSQVAFTSNRSGNFEIYVTNPDGSNLTTLANDASYDADPEWQPLVTPPNLVDDTKVLSGNSTTVDVLMNDFDAYGGVDPDSIIIVSQGTTGTAVVNDNSTITYTLNTVAANPVSALFASLDSFFFPIASAQSNGTDQFTYQACSIASSSLCATATVTINYSLTGAPNTGMPNNNMIVFAALALVGLGLVISQTKIAKYVRKAK